MSVLDNLTRKVSDTAKAAAKKSGNVVEVTRLNIGIGTEEEKVRKIYAEIGKLLYEDYTKGRVIDGVLLEYCEKIDAINRNICEMRQKILEMKNVKICPGCETELDIEMTFCYKCGKKQETPAPEGDADGE